MKIKGRLKEQQWLPIGTSIKYQKNNLKIELSYPKNNNKFFGKRNAAITCVSY